jgi:predicted DNA-binding ribbon-helix-helix protein
MSVNGIKGEIRKDEIKVISAVAWTTIGGEQRSVSLEDHFFNWVRR